MVYFVLDANSSVVKIGYSKSSSRRRLRTFKTGNARPLILLGEIQGSKAVESELHDHFHPWHLRGEWFRYDDISRMMVLGICQDGWPLA